MLSLAASAMDAPRGDPGITAYVSVADSRGGFDYVRLIPDDVVLARMDHALLTGVFIDADYSKEYAIDDAATLVDIDTASGTVSPIASLDGFEDASHISLAVDPQTGGALALVARTQCTASDLYGIDLATGATSAITAFNGCLQSMVFAPDRTLYALDRDNGHLVTLTDGIADVGPIGFALDDADTLAFAPGSDGLLLFAFEPSMRINALLVVDRKTGAGSVVGFFAGTVPNSAVALGGPLTDAIFADGFDG
jgi:hypothetical protein